jgi:hypothetical protein
LSLERAMVAAARAAEIEHNSAASGYTSPTPGPNQIAAGNTKRTRARGILRGDFLALAASPKRDSTHAQFIQPRRGNDLLFLALRNIFISN